MQEQFKGEKGKKVGWFCTYTPEEVIRAAGFVPYRLLPREDSRGSTEDILPPNICPYVRKVLNEIKNGDYPGDMQGLVIAHSCNAMMHLYNALREESVDFFVYLLEVPRKRDAGACEFFAQEMAHLADFLGEQGNPVNTKTLREALEQYQKRNRLIAELQEFLPHLKEDYPLGVYSLAAEASTSSPGEFSRKACRTLEEIKKQHQGNLKGNGSPVFILTGGIPPRGLVEILSENDNLELYPEICSGIRYLQKQLPDWSTSFTAGDPGREPLLEKLARSYLDKPPCPRLFDYNLREKFYRRLLDEMEVKGVVYHDLLFCDLGHYDYLMLKDILEAREIPFLKVSTELGQEDLGQLKTRVEAFMEIMS